MAASACRPGGLDSRTECGGRGDGHEHDHRTLDVGYGEHRADTGGDRQ